MPVEGHVNDMHPFVMVLRDKPAPMCDDCITRAAGWANRQSANQAGRRLANQRVIQRERDRCVSCGKVKTVSWLTGTSRFISGPAAQGASAIIEVEERPGQSGEQREAEQVIIAALAQELGVRLQPARLPLPDGSRMELDGATEDLSILVEAWAHQGPPKAAQKAKVSKDALKLVFAGRVAGTNPRRILLFCCEEAARPFLGRGWEASALREFGVEVLVVALPAGMRERVLAAQRRQYR